MLKVQVDSQGKIYTDSNDNLLMQDDGLKYNCSVNAFIGDINSNGVLQNPSEQSDVIFTGVQDIANYGLYYKFFMARVKTISFPDLTTISGSYACSYMCSNSTGLISVTMPKLVNISGGGALSRAFFSTNISSLSFPELSSVTGEFGMEYLIALCSNISSLSFPKLSSLTGNNALRYLCYAALNIQDVYFNSLTTTSFGVYTNQFTNLLIGTGTNVVHTLHFPSNMQSTIEGLTGYPLFGGTSGYVVCAFDLPATS